VTDKLPDPLVPADVDLRGYEFMPLYGDRLKKSETWIMASPEGKVAALELWWHSYAHEVPAGSLPDNERLLAQYAGYGAAVRAWAAIRDEAMRGWIICSDGRYYHRVVAELAIEAWVFKKAQRDRTEKARQARLSRMQSHGQSQGNKNTVTESNGGSNSNDSSQSHSGKSPVTESTGQDSTRQDSTRQGNGSGSDTSPQVQIALALRSLGVKGVNGTTHPTILRWVEDGFTLQQATDAAGIAINERGVKNPALNYVDAILRDPPRERKNKQESLEEKNRRAVEGWRPPELRDAAE
jgi:hypothetical protein